jgi:hypothetical protein
VATETKPEVTTAVATTTPGAVATVTDDRPDDNIGENRPDLLRYPFLSLFTAKSENAGEFTTWINTWVYDKSFSLGKDIVVIPVVLSMYYEQRVEFGSGEFPQKWTKLADATASGLPFQEAAEIRMLVEVPAELSIKDPRVLELAGRRYVAVVYNVRRTSFKVYRIMRADYTGWLSGGENGKLYGKRYANGQYLLGNEKKAGPAGPYQAPTIKAHGEVPADVRAAIKEKFGF